VVFLFFIISMTVKISSIFSCYKLYGKSLKFVSLDISKLYINHFYKMYIKI